MGEFIVIIGVWISYMGNYNLVQKVMKIQNWEYGPRVISLFGGASCVYSHGLRGFDGVKKITAFPSHGGGRNAYSPSPNIVGHSAVIELAFLLHANTIYTLEHLFIAWDILFKWRSTLKSLMDSHSKRHKKCTQSTLQVKHRK